MPADVNQVTFCQITSIQHAPFDEAVALSRTAHTRPVADVNREPIEAFELDPASLGEASTADEPEPGAVQAR